MQMQQQHKITAVMVALFLTSSSTNKNRASAYPSYVDVLPNGNQVTRLGTAQGAIGHTNPNGGGARNGFGQAFAAEGNTWTTDLCQADSDSDGVTNGMELGDPDCVWQIGMQPDRQFHISHPGFDDSTPETEGCDPTDVMCGGGGGGGGGGEGGDGGGEEIEPNTTDNSSELSNNTDNNTNGTDENTNGSTNGTDSNNNGSQNETEETDSAPTTPTTGGDPNIPTPTAPSAPPTDDGGDDSSPTPSPPTDGSGTPTTTEGTTPTTPQPDPNTDSDSSADDDGLSGAAIVGIVLGVLLVLGVIFAAAVVVMKRRSSAGTGQSSDYKAPVLSDVPAEDNNYGPSMPAPEQYQEQEAQQPEDWRTNI